MKTFQIKDSFSLQNQGTAIVFEDDSGFIFPQSTLQLRITRPDGTILETIAYRQIIRKTEPGPKRVSLLVPQIEKSDLPIGSLVDISEIK